MCRLRSHCLSCRSALSRAAALETIGRPWLPPPYSSSPPSPLLVRSFGSTSDKRRRRRRRRSPPPPVNTTTRDRLRMLQEANVVERESLSIKQVNRLLERAQGRASWLRDKLYEHWNPDYAAQQQRRQQTAATVGTPRPVKYELNMDVRWWMWNVAFALLPAALIGLYCEFRGQYVMYEYHRRQKLEQMRQIMGEEFVAEYADRLLLPPPDNFIVRFQKMVREVTAMVKTTVRDMLGGEEEGAEEEQPAGEEAGEAAAQQSSEQALDDDEHDASPEALLRRIRRLEQETARRSDDDRFLRYQMERMDQSGVRNRSDDRLIEQWRRAITEKQQEKRKEAPSASKQTQARSVREEATTKVEKPTKKPSQGQTVSSEHDEKIAQTAVSSSETAPRIRSESKQIELKSTEREARKEVDSKADDASEKRGSATSSAPVPTERPEPEAKPAEESSQRDEPSPRRRPWWKFW